MQEGELVRTQSPRHSCLTSCIDPVISSMKTDRYVGVYNVPDMRAKIVHD